MRRAGALSLLTLLFGCDPHQAEETDVQELQFETGSKRPSIEVRLEQGSIEVIGSDSRSVKASFVRRARSVDHDTARGLLERIEVSGVQTEERIRFEGRADSRYPVSFGRSLSTDLALVVPREADLDLHTEDGDIEVEGIAGKVVAAADDGDISVSGVSGELRIRVEDGSIQGKSVEADVDAATEDGEIELEGTFRRLRAVTSDGTIRVDSLEWAPTAEPWVLRTGDGAIFLELPRSVSADLDATTNDGDIVNRLSAFQGDEREGRLRGKLGAGGPLLLLSTMDGTIEVTQK